MKKTIKSLIIASSVAAVAGIGAVSFAAWSGGNATASPNGLTAGEITFEAVGFENSTPNVQVLIKDATTYTALVADTHRLVPYNQTAEIKDGKTAVFMYRIDLKTLPGTYTDKKIKVVSDSNSPAGLFIKIDTSDSVTALPSFSGGEGTAWTTSDDGWKAINQSTANDAYDTVPEATKKYYAYVVLASDNNDYSNNGGKTIKLTFSIA